MGRMVGRRLTSKATSRRPRWRPFADLGLTFLRLPAPRVSLNIAPTKRAEVTVRVRRISPEFTGNQCARPTAFMLSRSAGLLSRLLSFPDGHAFGIGCH